MSEAPPVLDLGEALKRSMGDADFLKMMLAELKAMIPETLAGLRTAIEAGDMAAVDRPAHQFKGAAGSLGAQALSAAAYELEMIGKSNRSDEAPEIFDQLSHAAQTLVDQIDTIDWANIES